MSSSVLDKDNISRFLGSTARNIQVLSEFTAQDDGNSIAIVSSPLSTFRIASKSALLALVIGM